jgi:hypothetical protein
VKDTLRVHKHRCPTFKTITTSNHSFITNDNQ